MYKNFVHTPTPKGMYYIWSSEAYLDCIDTLDVLIGLLLAAVEGHDVLVLMSSDHGGHDYSHGSYIDEDLLIPMFVRGMEQIICLSQNDINFALKRANLQRYMKK